MAGKKISVFIMVVTFHMVVLGVVYLSTRSDEPEEKKSPAEVNKGTTSGVPKSSTSGKYTKTTSDGPKSSTSGKYTKTTSDGPKSSTSGKYTIHVVASGDFLGKIASKYNVSSKAIMELNDIKDPNKIRLGQKLKIPLK